MSEDAVGRVLLHHEMIAQRVRELGRRIARDVEHDRERANLPDDDRLVLITVLTGAMVFAADLIRAMDCRMTLRAVTTRSYPGRATASQGVELLSDVPDDLEGRRVVIVDDILDTGRTLGALRDRVLAQNPASLRICVLLRKHKQRDVEVHADYAAFDIPDAFVVGCGLDFDGLYRNLPDVRELDLAAHDVAAAAERAG